MTPNSIRGADFDAFLADDRFTRTFDCPGLRISYADFGYRNEEQPELEKVFLFFGPLLGSRMLLAAKDTVAKAHKVRIVATDRPGFGKTTPNITPERRLVEWRGAIMALLQHLRIQDAASEGAGYLGLAAPWIHPSHSGIWQMAILQALPQSLLAKLTILQTLPQSFLAQMSMRQALPESLLTPADKAASYFTAVSAPALDKGLDLADSLRGWWQGPQRQRQRQQQTDEEREVEESIVFAEALDPKLDAFIFADSVVGMSNDSIMLLQRPNDTGTDGHGGGSAFGWADWGDYDILIPRLMQALSSHGRRIVVEAFFSQTDSMTGTPGTPGPDWFIGCWEKAAAASDSPISFSYRVVPGTTHNTVLSTRPGVARVMFKHIQSLASSVV